MKNIARLKILLRPEQLKAMEEVLLKAELTLESFKLVRKDYARIKSNVKKYEKKLLTLTEQEGYGNYLCKFIENEIARIENKYKNIEHAIKHYNIAMKCFNDSIAVPGFLSFNPNETHNSALNNLKHYLGAANGRIDEAADAMRITKRYSKQITEYFKMHAKHQAMLSARKASRFGDSSTAGSATHDPAEVKD